MVAELRRIDKADWQDGPWLDEPDQIQWKDPKTNMQCLMLRDPELGHWCGYVSV